MKRLLISAASAVLVAAGSLAVTVVSPTAAGADVNNLTMVNSATYDFPTAAFPFTACVDGVSVGNLDVGEHVTTTITTDTDHQVGFIQGADEDCSIEPEYLQLVNIPESVDVTVSMIWAGEGLEAVQLFDDTACYEGTGRITLRPGAYLAGTVDLMGTVEGVRDVIVAGIQPGEQGTVDLPAGTVISDATIVTGGNPDDLVVALGDLTVIADSDLQIYLAGGSDGDIGAFSFSVAGEPCTAPTTTTAIAVADATDVAPAFTG